MNRIYRYSLYVLLIGVFVSVPLSESQAGPYTILHEKGVSNADNGNQVAVSTTLSHANESATDDDHYRHYEDAYRGAVEPTSGVTETATGKVTERVAERTAAVTTIMAEGSL